LADEKLRTTAAQEIFDGLCGNNKWNLAEIHYLDEFQEQYRDQEIFRGELFL
jgi:hypothetical protein